MHKVVFDTVVFVRSLINPLSFCGRVVFQYYSHYRLFVSQQILTEVLEVLQRTEVTSKYHFIAGMDINRVLDILSRAEVVDTPHIPLASRDIKDDKFLAAAKVAGCSYIVSQDDDLLDMKEYDGIQIITCGQFITILEQASSA